ncbi:hypothetical protein Tco_0496483 [Tanacetum coccineum]
MTTALSIENGSSIEGRVLFNFNVWVPIGKCNRVLERQKKLRNQIFRALTASADVPSSVTETTDTTSTLPPPPPPLQKPTGHRDIWEKVKDQKSRMHHYYKDGKVRYSFLRSCQNWRDLPRDNPLVSTEVLRSQVDADLEENHGPSDAMHNHSATSSFLEKQLVSFVSVTKHAIYCLITRESRYERWQSAPARSLISKRLASLEPRRSSNYLV